MKLKDYRATLEEKMSEFDLWVTPSLGEIRDTEQFKVNLSQLILGFDLLAEITNNFDSCEKCSADVLAENTIPKINAVDQTKGKAILDSICNVLLLATGKTDNNLKCQYPLLLKTKLGIHEYPQQTAKGTWINKSIPRTFGIEDVTKVIVQLKENASFQIVLSKTYFQLIVSDKMYAKQLWSLGNAYCNQKVLGNEEALISSIVIFQSRGSITASQGHIPETILRKYMSDWGLVSGIDFNTQDVEIGTLLEDIEIDKKIKKRKYDFILPFKSRKSGSKIFIQCQFYAGDSGSVSHKVVDQTDSTREVTLKKYPQAVFLEYLDGAGYFASLNGDLRKMLAKSTTKDFIQIRTAPLKLRRELQGIEFLTPLEIEHSIVRTSGKKEEVIESLKRDGYSLNEINQAIQFALNNRIFSDVNNELLLKPDRIEIIRRYCLLDIVANYGEPIPDNVGTGYLVISGYAVYWGLQQDTVLEMAVKEFPKLDDLWESKLEPVHDIQWLLNNGFIMMK